MTSIIDNFIGSLVGAQLGDTLGMPVEGYSHKRIQSHFGKVDRMLEARLGKGTYTDDTEMMIATAESLIECNGFDGHHMAQSFIKNCHPERGYGTGTMRALSFIKAGVDWDKAGTMVFEGGSFGNGAAMRVAPVGLLYYDDLKTLHDVSVKASRITHAHVLGAEGAFLQACAVSLALLSDARDSFNPYYFLSDLIKFISTCSEIYKEKLEDIGRFLYRSIERETIIELFGNDSSALHSVPTALYCFLSHFHSFEEAVVYAVSLGGDSDTIGAMTGAISGAYHGIKALPLKWINDLENEGKGRDYIEGLATALWSLRRNVV